MAPKKDLIGQRFGSLVVLHEAELYVSPNGNTLRRWHCKCDCGREVDVKQPSLTSGKVTHCGCKWATSTRNFGSKRTDLFAIDRVGEHHDFLTIIGKGEPLIRKGRPRTGWIVHCDVCNQNHTMTYTEYKVKSCCGCARLSPPIYDHKHICEKCGKPFQPVRGAERYCSKCREEMKNKKKYSIVKTGVKNVTVQGIADFYEKCKSIPKTQKNYKITRLSTEKILIGAGVMTSEKIERVKELYAQGKSRSEICAELRTTSADISRYTPYAHEIKFEYIEK